MNPKRQRPTGWQAEQGAMSNTVGTGDSKANGSDFCGARKPDHAVAERALREARRVLREVHAALVGAPAAEVRRVRPLVRWLREAEAGALLAMRHQQTARAPQSAPRPVARVARQRERRSRPLAHHLSVVGADPDSGSDDDSSRPMPPDGFYSVLPFGRYEGRTVGEVARRHRDYVRWVLDNVRLYPRLRRALTTALRFYEEQEAIK